MAVELFAEVGYADVEVSQIASRAEVSTGAFYYHFSSKTALADAVIGQGWPRVWSLLVEHTGSGSGSRKPGLENMISMTFAISALFKRDETAAMGHHLSQAFSQLSGAARDGYRQREESFILGVAVVLQNTDLRDGVTPEHVGRQIWMNVNGCHTLSYLMGDNVITRMAEGWRMLLPAITPAESLPYFEEFVTRTAAQYLEGSVV